GGERVLARFGEGELLGEMAIFRQAPRSAAAVAATDTELLVIKSERLEWLIRNRPQLTMEIIKRLSEWVADTDATRARRGRLTSGGAKPEAPDSRVLSFPEVEPPERITLRAVPAHTPVERWGV
ncbi:MAG: cyclic nucleotide-binding domain-containing protein, partial [Candidatus Rokubacteria bacterium]|nr:cyclic nucleotide-binding domain-containing protein [Candidatus Rokubacteria bacterium]